LVHGFEAYGRVDCDKHLYNLVCEEPASCILMANVVEKEHDVLVKYDRLCLSVPTRYTCVQFLNLCVHFRIPLPSVLINTQVDKATCQSECKVCFTPIELYVQLQQYL
jgi:hypothetical protein